MDNNKLIEELKESQQSLNTYIEDMKQDLEYENSKLNQEYIGENEGFFLITFTEKLETLINRTETVKIVIDNLLSKLEDDTGKKERIINNISSLREYIKSKKG